MTVIASENFYKKTSSPPFFRRCGIVLSIADLSTLNLLALAKHAEINTIALHNCPGEGSILDFINTPQGRDFIEQCSLLQIDLEYAFHSINELLPRELFGKNPEMFRMNEKGERIYDSNLCVHSKEAVEIVLKNMTNLSKVLRPTTGRYFYWIDDGKPMCKCTKCRELSDSEQALILENQMIRKLREINPSAMLSHLAYLGTIDAPRNVYPEDGIFLEFAPFERTWQRPISDVTASGKISHKKYLEYLAANLEVFGVENAQVLEYWLDVSLFSGWKRDAKKQLRWNREIFIEDIKTYARFGIRNITTFGAYIDADYVRTYGLPPMDQYGHILKSFQKIN